MAWLTFAPITTGAARHYGVSASTIGLLSEVFPLIYVVGAVPASRALDSSLRAWLAAGGALSAAGALVRLAGTARDGFIWCLVGQIMVAAAQPLLLNAVVALARRYLAPPDRPTGIAIGSAGTFLGFVLAFVTSDALGARHIAALLVMGAVYAAIGALLLAVALARSTAPSADSRLADKPERTAGLAELRALWADPVMRGLAYLVFVGFGVFVALVTWVQPLLQPAGVSTSTTDTLLTVMVLGGVVTSAVVPPLVARWHYQLPILVTAGVATIVACLMMAAAPGLGTAAVGLVIAGLLLLPGMPVMLEVAERFSGAGAAAGAGFLWLAGQAGGIVVAAVTGAVEGTPWLAFTVMALVIALAVPAALRLRGRLTPAGAVN
jgi:predicted MFS family arabinose efflux permease